MSLRRSMRLLLSLGMGLLMRVWSSSRVRRGVSAAIAMGLSQSQRMVMMTGMSVCGDMGVEFYGSSFSYRPRVLSSNLGAGEFGGDGGDRLWV